MLIDKETLVQRLLQKIAETKYEHFETRSDCDLARMAMLSCLIEVQEMEEADK